MRVGRSVDKALWRFNHASIKVILRELDIDYHDGYKDMVMRCFMSESCKPHEKKTLYLNCDEQHPKCGCWHCFRCDKRGYIDSLVRAKTGWAEFRVYSFLLKNQAFFDPDDRVENAYVTVTTDLLDQYMYRHAYCYDRGLNEETLLRYGVGFDRAENEIVFPWYATDGRLAAIKKRAILTKYYRLLPTDDFVPTVFGIHLITKGSVIWITEGEFDAMFVDQSLREAGIRNQGAIALGGKDIQTRVLDQLMQPSPSLFVNALDNDDEGKEAATKLNHMLSQWVPCHRFKYHEGVKDPNDSLPETIVHTAHDAETILLRRSETQELRYERWLAERSTT